MTAYLSADQVEKLLGPINPVRVGQRDGLSHLEAYDVRAHLNRMFGFARWSADLLDLTMLYDNAVTLKNGKPGFGVAYRATLRLTICAPGGAVLATYTEAATGDGQMPDFKHADAHDFAIKTAESQALKRCAINLGDQFGLSLYAKGSKAALVKRTLVMPEGAMNTAQAAHLDHDLAPVVPEVDQSPAGSLSPAVSAAPPVEPPSPDGFDVEALRTKALDLLKTDKATASIGITRLRLDAARAKALNVMTTLPSGPEVTLDVFLDHASKAAANLGKTVDEAPLPYKDAV